ncbi:MAG TPA: glycosyltransferase family 2 protein [Bacteroidales bacterium]|nr:glycosyltransferase family 2 protein [Bacteroidales bacterium]
MISVCIPTYNGEKYIHQQLESILTQLGNDDEVIISDDSSTDGTIAIINSFNDNRIKLFEGCTFKSPVFNLENALKHAQGDHIFLSDQDDVWLPGKVATMMGYLKDYNIVVSDCIVVNQEEKVINDSFYSIVNSRTGFFKNFSKNSYLGCCMAFKRNMLAYFLPFPSGIAMHDIWMGLVSEVFGKPVFIPDKLILYRRHDRNMTHPHLKSKNTFTYKIRYRIVLIYQIMLRAVKVMRNGQKYGK